MTIKSRSNVVSDAGSSRTHNRNTRMARPKNQSARKALPWIGYDLDSSENCDRFIQDLLKATWTGKLGTRQASTCLAAVRLLLEGRGWIGEMESEPEAIDDTTIQANEIKQFTEHLTEDEQAEMARMIKRYEELLTIGQERATTEDPNKAFKEGDYKAPIETRKEGK